MKQQTLVLIKPEAMKKKLIGYILNKLAERNIEIVGIKTVKVTKELANKHYKHLRDKPFYPNLIKYICGEKHNIEHIIAIVYEGEDCIKIVREVAGATNPEEANPTSIRGCFGRITSEGLMENVVHASSSEEDAEIEIKLWFSPSELASIIYATQNIINTKQEQSWK